MLVTLVAGARPNFMKIAPIIDAVVAAKQQGKNIAYRLVHTGQHYDKNMSDSFFEELGIPEPDVNLECGGGTQAEQAANIMVRFEKELLDNPTNLVLVVGDVTSTMACSIAAKKLCIDVAHVEAGIRSGDITMPEEINRMVTDSITDLFFTTSDVANNNLLQAGVAPAKIHFVGNTMIDTLLKQMPRLQPPAVTANLGLQPQQYFVITLHRPANVDGEYKLKILINEIIRCANGLPVIFPVHPRTAKNLQGQGIAAPNLHMIEPLSYLQFNYLVKHAKAVITDSGGITEETTVMGVPCITLRNSTERPETVTIGTNELIGTNPEALAPHMQKIFANQWKKGAIPEMWDGKTAERIVGVLTNLYP
ncbi:MAG: UDP-N-acetylglucosamine 2-epimerase (non-hydrolyzing) [Sphingobacteriales bacterium]|nr:MAG: UDP-N-acetylglucosamine 2-epimerase (non-hydrolyzing) [Sphingobacteriales bacterium]